MPTTYTSAVSRAPKASQTGIGIVVDTKALSRLAKNLRKAAPDAWKAYRVTARAAGQIIAEDAKARSSWSSRIPASIKVRVTAGGNIKVVAGGPAAPDAAALENHGLPGTFRHPVYGNRDVWVQQRARPFLAPALDAHREEIARMAGDAIADAVNRAIGGR